MKKKPSTKTQVKYFTTGKCLIDYLVEECEALNIPLNDSALIQRLKSLHLNPIYAGAEFFVQENEK